MSLTGYLRMCCIAANYSTTIRYTMSPFGDISITFRFLCDELSMCGLCQHIVGPPSPPIAFVPLAIHLRPPILGSPLDEASL
ncbi:hypothetical protein BHE74_00001256 [Ensete ventricosum]|nr:hypothetical protein BHE74_00001256 [Ensete ventricosum]